ncbi:hypothetical protein J14TS2_33660 [Bacillus sp. J14TS2]|uniref:DinB family protein n=1 Tax=Bacillus sp. J14TS2 TaxID=2807188 RepID=UPI001B1ECE54|nr:DinB family protein [Bacillus sp. J14TS2]GIN72891.1 hypothetical protein J14TS2_33660 [Bacillus sp. J14TS2]
MDKEICLEHPQFGRLETYLVELVQHVVNQGTYHRGNLTNRDTQVYQRIIFSISMK